MLVKFSLQAVKYILGELFTKLRRIPGMLLRGVNICYEKARGLDFSGIIQPEMEGHCAYEASRGMAAYIMLRAYLCSRVSNNDAIIDIGCGKGRMICFFAKFAFKKTDGLEYSPELAGIAERNLRRLGINGAEVIRGDASEFEDIDGYNYFYMFNPFGEAIMKQFVLHLKESISRTPRKIRVIYRNPVLHPYLLYEGFKVEEDLRRTLKANKIYNFLWRNMPTIIAYTH